MTSRRQFISLVGAAAAWPMAARAQSGERMRRIGVLRSAPISGVSQELYAVFVERLRTHGWVEGHNIRVEYHSGGVDDATLAAAARELVASRPDVIVLTSNPAVVALREIDRSIPAVFAQVGDPVGSGFVDSLARPGGNLTGLSTFEAEMAGKWVEILKEIVPAIQHCGVIFDPRIAANVTYLRMAEAAAAKYKIMVSAYPGKDGAEIEAAIHAVGRVPNSGIIAIPNPSTALYRERIAKLAIHYRLPSAATFRYMVAGGMLVSYGVSPVDLYRRAADFVHRILKGTKPADIPVETPTRFEMIVNLKTAKAIGLTVPASFLLRADEVIE